MSKGYVYILANPYMPGLVKIGRSVSGGAERAKSLYTTGVPAPFEVVTEILFQDCEDAENLLHEKLQDKRLHENREFFECDPWEAVTSLIQVHAGIFCMRATVSPLGDVVDDVMFLASEIGEKPLNVADAMQVLSVDAVRAAVYKRQKARKEAEARIRTGGFND